MCKNYCLITAEEDFKEGQVLTKGRIGVFPSVESIYEKMPPSTKLANNYKLMEIDVSSDKLKNGPNSLILMPNSNAKVTKIMDIS